ncbi:MAG TPA: hypothetical protein PKJ68_04960 [Candidatus Woesebacteria bacterium]|nr:hypothetical protein [Candidatus Woesebacteria bacterium]
MKLLILAFLIFIGFKLFDRSVDVEFSSYASYGQHVNVRCENHGFLMGTWTKCLFENNTKHRVPVRNLSASCYKGKVKTGDRSLSFVIDPNGAFEESFVCGGRGVTKVYFE